MRDDDLRERVISLEWQLADYHERLEEALEHNNEFQMKATWGIIRGTSWLSFVGAYWLFGRLWKSLDAGEPTWLVSIGLFFASGAIWYWYTGYVERGYEGDREKMMSWPIWRKAD